MHYYVLKNLFTDEDVRLIDYAIRGMMLANDLERHSSQSETYGKFSMALHNIVKIVYDEHPNAAVKIMEGWQFEGTDGQDFMAYVNDLVKEDTSTVTDMLCEAVIAL